MRSEYTELLSAIEGEIAKLLPENPDEAWFARFFGALPAPPAPDIRRALNAPALDLMRRGGKRWRPLLLVLSARAYGRTDGALSLAPLVEIAHNGTLIVDDIEDSSDTRRGGPAIHLVHGADAAINAGNLMYFLPLALIDELSPPASPVTARSAVPIAECAMRLDLHARYALHMRRLHLGQAMDIQWHRDHSRLPARADYLAMCALKTGVLARAAAELGAVAAGAAAAAADALGAAFEGAGVAFQILDDVRNLRSGNPGKKRGDDIVEGKKSLPVILACAAEPALAVRLESLFAEARAGGPESPAVEEAIGLIAATGALDAAESEARAMLERGQSEVARLCPLSAAPSPDAAAARELLAGLVPALAGA